MGSRTDKGIAVIGDDDFCNDSRLNRRMKRRSVSNRSCRDFSETKNNIVAAAKEIIAIDDNSDYDLMMYLHLKCSGVPGFADLHDGYYDDINLDNNNNVHKRSGGVPNKCADDGNSEDKKCADDENAEASDVFTDPEYKSFLENCSVRNHEILFSLGDEVFVYGRIDDDGVNSCKKKICDSRTLDTEAERNSTGFRKRRRMSVVGNRNNIENPVGPVDNLGRATESLKIKTESSIKEGNNCGLELANNDREYNLALNFMAVDATRGESVAGHFKKVRYSQDEKNQSDVQVLESQKGDKNSGVKLVDSSPECNLSSYGDRRNKKNTAKHCYEVGCGEDEKNEPDEEVTILEWNPYSGGERTPFVSSKSYEVFADDCRIPNSGRKVSSEYMEELIKYLKKPYAKAEYSQLMVEVSCRKQVVRDMNLRSGSKLFKTKVMGKSYLDRHKDLHLKIIEAKSDKLKVLNILRGFFFWLQIFLCVYPEYHPRGSLPTLVGSIHFGGLVLGPLHQLAQFLECQLGVAETKINFWLVDLLPSQPNVENLAEAQ